MTSFIFLTVALRLTYVFATVCSCWPGCCLSVLFCFRPSADEAVTGLLPLVAKGTVAQRWAGFAFCLSAHSFIPSPLVCHISHRHRQCISFSAVLHLGPREHAVYRGGGDVHPAEGAHRATLRGRHRRLGQPAGHHPWRVVRPLASQVVRDFITNRVAFRRRMGNGGGGVKFWTGSAKKLRMGKAFG